MEALDPVGESLNVVVRAWTRTRDIRIMSPVLYQLSYGTPRPASRAVFYVNLARGRRVERRFHTSCSVAY